MLGRAASLQAGRKENRWPTGGRGSRVGPHSGLDPKLLSGPRPLDFSDPIKAQRVPWGWGGGAGERCGGRSTVFVLLRAEELGEGGSLGKTEEKLKESGFQQWRCARI